MHHPIGFLAIHRDFFSGFCGFSGAAELGAAELGAAGPGADEG